MRVVGNIRAGRKAGYAGLRRRQGEDPRAAAACRGAGPCGRADDHLNHCVRQAAAEGGEVADEKLSEVEKVISRLVRS